MTVLLSCLSRFAGVSQCGTGETVCDSGKIKFPSREGARKIVKWQGCVYTPCCRRCIVQETHPCPPQEGSHYTVPACLALSRVACLQKP